MSVGSSAWGMIHGRFQPFHNGHLSYLAAAAARCERLLVGITNPERLRTPPEADDPERHLPLANPFTYTERLLMVAAAAQEAGIAPVHVVPFPIAEPECWDDYVPSGTVHLLRVLSPWGAAKRARLEAHGQAVVELEAGEGKDVSGARVRAAMRAGEDWEAMVPRAVAWVIGSLPGRDAPAARPAP